MNRAAFISPLLLAACGTPAAVALDGVTVYGGVEATLLEGNLVQFDARAKGTDTPDDVIAYARCAAAQYGLVRGFGFARHLRTNVNEKGGVWSADAVYTFSPSLPRGFDTIDAEVVVADCAENGIPTV